MNTGIFYIENIEITKLFGNKTIKWHLRPDVNILGGINGSGKSTILKACYELLSKGGVFDLKCNRLMDSVSITFSNKSVITWKHSSVKSVGEPSSQFAEGSNQVVNDPKSGRVFFNNVYAVGPDEIPCRIDEIISDIIIENVNSFEQRIADAIQLSKLPDENREADSTLLDALIKEEVNHRNEIYSGAYETLLEMVRDKKLNEINSHPNIMEFFQLGPICSEFFPGYAFSLMNKMEFKKGESIIPYNHLSMGQKQLLLILLKVTNTQKKPAIFFMDEPDLGMHVDWKKKLLKTIHQLNPNIQQIVSTHAPSMVTGWGDCVKEIGQITLNGED